MDSQIASIFYEYFKVSIIGKLKNTVRSLKTNVNIWANKTQMLSCNNIINCLIDRRQHHFTCFITAIVKDHIILFNFQVMGMWPPKTILFSVPLRNRPTVYKTCHKFWDSIWMITIEILVRIELILNNCSMVSAKDPTMRVLRTFNSEVARWRQKFTRIHTPNCEIAFRINNSLRRILLDPISRQNKELTLFITGLFNINAPIMNSKIIINAGE